MLEHILLLLILQKEVAGYNGDTNEDIQAVHGLRLSGEASPQLKVTILGCRESERCIIVERDDLQEVWKGTTQVLHYIITGVL